MSSHVNSDKQYVTHSQSDRTSFPAQSSVIDERAIFQRILPLYDLASAPRSCRFLTRGDSDVYRVLTDTETYYLKIRRPPVSTARCNAEARLVVNLATEGLPVVRPIPLRRGGYAEEIQASEGPRPVLLFEAAPARLVDSFDTGQARQFGQMLANLHVVADRRPVDPDLGEADSHAAYGWVREIDAGILLTEEQHSVLDDAARRIVMAYSSLPRSAPEYGPIHGDLARSNIRWDNAGHATLFDFGAAERGWRVNELANVWRQALPRSTPQVQTALWQAFLIGYASAHPVPANLNDFRQFNALAAKLSTTAYICGSLTLRLGIEPIEEHNIAQQVLEVKQLLTELPSSNTC